MGSNCKCWLLYAAIQNDDEPIVLYLLKSFEINEKHCKNFTLLSWAVLSKNVKMARLLLDQGASPNLPDIEFYPIHHAVSVGSLEIFKLILEYSGDMHQRTVFETHSIHLAARYGRVEFLEYILEHGGVDINLEDTCGSTPLCVAIMNGHTDAAEFLMKHKADVTTIDRYGNTHLHIAIGFGFKTMTKLLIRNGAKLNKRNFSGWTPLLLAARLGNFKIIKLLYKAGAECAFTGKCRHYSPLHVAADSGRLDILDYFLSKGADVNFQTEQGYTLLHAAAQKGHPNVALFLIDRGADINCTTVRNNYSALDFAARSGNPSTINILIQNLAKFELNSNGESRLLELLSKQFFYYDFISEINYKAAAEVIIRFHTLRNRQAPLLFPENFPFLEELREFWLKCKRDLKDMDKNYLGKTSITLYKLMKALFDDRQLGKYLCNKEISVLYEDLEANIETIPRCENIKRLIKTGVYRGRLRQNLSDRIVSMVTEQCSNMLPPEIIIKISDFLSIEDLMNFVCPDTMRAVEKLYEC